MKSSGLTIYCSSFRRTSATLGYSNPKLVNKALSGKDNFMKDYEKSHIKTNFFQKVLLGLGSGFVSITSPSRGDMIAVMGEVTGYQALDYMRTKMNESEEGRKILEDKPRISSGSLDLEKLKSYPEGTLGKAYSNFLEKYGYTPDTRNSVQFVDDIELAYIAQRYRETHDLIHTLLDMPTNMLGEVSVKWVEAIQFKLPMCATGALFGAVRLAPKLTRSYSTKLVFKFDSSVNKQINSGVVTPKQHPGVMNLPCIVLPVNIMETIKSILNSVNSTQKFIEKAKQFNISFLNRNLPVDKDQERVLYLYYYNYFKSKIDGDIEENESLRIKLENKVKKRLKSHEARWGRYKFNKATSLLYLTGRTSAEYAVVKRVLNEIHKRDKEFAPKSLLDFGSGVGTVNWVAHEFWGNTLEEYYNVDAEREMNELAARILRQNSADNEPFIKTVYYRQFFPATPRLFDIVVSAYSFFELSSCEQRMRMLTALWNDTKEYLVLIECGSNWGFQIISEARDYILHISKKYGIDCYVFAPCPHDLFCPRIIAEGKKTPCNFNIKFKMFSFGNEFETGNENFCFLIVRKRPKPDEADRPCRIVRKVSKKSCLVHFNVCTTKGILKSLPITPSKHGKTAHLCARASVWGDLFPGTFEQTMLHKPKYKKIAGRDKELMLDSNSNSDSERSDSDSSISKNNNNIENTENDKK